MYKLLFNLQLGFILILLLGYHVILQVVWAVVTSSVVLLIGFIVMVIVCKIQATRKKCSYDVPVVQNAETIALRSNVNDDDNYNGGVNKTHRRR